jgi:S1-C subfamily serine protease
MKERFLSRFMVPIAETNTDTSKPVSHGPRIGPSIRRFGSAGGLLLLMAVGWCGAVEAGTIDRSKIQNAVKATAYIEVQRVYRGYDFSNAGSGFFVHPDGFLMTNWHVVADQVEMFWAGAVRELSLTVVRVSVVVNPGSPSERTLLAKVVGRDRKRDLALLKVDYRSAHWIAPSEGVRLAVMDEVFVVGFPFGDLLTFNEHGGISLEGYPEPSINSGRVTSLRRDSENRVVAVQTDAAINPGNSGGPMLDANGRLAGVVYAGVGGSQIGFAIAPLRVHAFYLERLFQVKFVPPYVPNPRSRVKITVERGILPLDASRISVHVEGADIEAFDVDLKESDLGWEADIEVPEVWGETSNERYYTASLRMYDSKGNRSFQRKYRLSEVDSAGVGLKSQRDPMAMMRDRKLSNSLTLEEYARKRESESAAEADNAKSQASAAPLSATPEPELTAESPENTPPLRTDSTVYAKEVYKEGRYEEAVEVLERVLKSDPTDEIAREYLDMARERLRIQTTAGTTSVEGEFAAAETVVKPDTETAEIRLTFDSPIRAGRFNFWVDDEPLASVDFSFKKKMFGKAPSARIDKTIEIAPGRHSLTVSLEDEDQKSRGLFTFSETFDPESRWTLRVVMPSDDAKPDAFLVQRR